MLLTPSKHKLVVRKCVNLNLALVSGAQWIECRPENQRVAGLIPSQGTCLGSRLGDRWGPFKRDPHTDVSLPLFLPLFPSD